MPNNKRARHPSGLGIEFIEDGHTYTDDFGVAYTSGTTLIHNAFEAFDAKKVAAAKSARTGVPADSYIQQWMEAGEEAANSGTRLHENCERQILGRFNEMHKPENNEEQLKFRTAWHEVERIKTAFAGLEPEKIIFSPRFRISGSIDLLAKKNDQHYVIVDWKVVKQIKMEGFRGKKGIHIATAGIPDCNFYHYALQLSTYEQILKSEGYIPATAQVDRWLNVYRPEGRFDYVQLPDLGREAIILMAFNATIDGIDDIPF